MTRTLVLLIVAVVAIGCDSGTGPSKGFSGGENAAGTWTGTMQFSQPTIAATPFTQSVSLTLTATGTSVAGTWTGGTVNGTLTGSSFSGTLTFSVGGLCTGTMSVTGTISGNTLAWASPAVVWNCTDPPINITINATRL